MKTDSGFVERLRQQIANRQKTDPAKISVAQAAKDLRVPETTLRSTLEGRFPRHPDYWRKLRAYCRSNLDWLICGLGPPPDQPEGGRPRERILVVEQDLDRVNLIRMALKGFNLEIARRPEEAALLIAHNLYDLILAGAETCWSEEELSLLRRQRARPRLVLLAGDVPASEHPFGRLADETIGEPLEAARIVALVREQLALLEAMPLGPAVGAEQSCFPLVRG